jgi:hypothetical protein
LMQSGGSISSVLKSAYLDCFVAPSNVLFLPIDLDLLVSLFVRLAARTLFLN